MAWGDKSIMTLRSSICEWMVRCGKTNFRNLSPSPGSIGESVIFHCMQRGIERHAFVRSLPQTADLYGDPTKPGVFVTRVRYIGSTPSPRAPMTNEQLSGLHGSDASVLRRSYPRYSRVSYPYGGRCRDERCTQEQQKVRDPRRLVGRGSNTIEVVALLWIDQLRRI